MPTWEERQLTSILADAPWGIYVFRIRPDGRMSCPYATPGLEKLFGVALDDIRDDAGPLFANMVPEDVPAVIAAIHAAAAVMGPFHHDFRIRRSDGTARWVRARSTPTLEPDGSSLWQGFCEDVTDIRDAQLQLATAQRESDERVSAILDSAMDGVISVDDSMHVVIANPAADAIFGYPPGSLVGVSLDTLLPAESRAGHPGAMRGLAAGPAFARRHAVDGVRADGTRVPLEASISHVVVGGKNLYTVACRDLSEKLRTQHALEAGEERFRQLAESIREVFWLFDTETGRVLYVSPAYEAVWKRSPAALERDPAALLEAVHPEDRERVTEAWTSMAERGHDIEYRITWPDGTVRWVHDRAFPVRDGSGRGVRVAGVNEDVTERRALEEQLQQTQKMESIGRLAGGVAHDFNNLLTVIVSTAELLRDEVAEQPSVVEMANDMLDAGRRGAALTRQLLAFTRQEVVEPKVMDLSSVVADTEKLLRRLIGEDVALITRLDARAPLVRIDPGQWTQVLLNLAVNARDAMPRGGSLRIHTFREVVDGVTGHPGVAAGTYTVLQVRDDGTGMTPAVRSRIFEPFFTTKPRGKGSGLGLAVVYGVVHQAGGHIEVTTAPDRGTTFDILLPAASASGESSAPSDRDRAPGTGTETVLLVEDEESVRRVASRILGSKGYRVIQAGDGEEALRAIATLGASPDLLVTDVVMPNMDGGELASRVRERHPHTKILFTSGYVDESITLRGVPSGGTSFLQKPYTPQILLARVREVLDG